MNDWKNKGEKNIKMVRRVTGEPDKDSCTKGRENFSETAPVDGIRSCNDFADEQESLAFCILVSLFYIFSTYLYLNRSQ